MSMRNMLKNVRNTDGKYTQLRWSYVVGYVDHFDVVHSRIFSMLDEDDIKTHYDLFGMVLKAWRWTYSNGLDATLGDRMDKEDWQKIREHLTETYDIPFYSNGYHDVQFFCDRMAEEDKEMKK